MGQIKVHYKNQEHTLDYFNTDRGMCVRKGDGFGGITIPPGCLHDVETLKPYIIMAIEGKQDYDAIQQLHGTEIL